MHPVLFKLGHFSIYSWGFMVALAFGVGIYIAVLRAEKEGLEPEKIMDLSLYVLVSAIIGARLFYVIGFFDEFRSNILSAFTVWEGGMVFYGGLLTSLIVFVWYTRKHGLPLLKVLDIAAPTVAIGYAIGRIGCFLRGCCFGIQCSLPWAVHFPGIEGFRHPTQLYSSLAGVLMFVILIFIRDRKKYDGEVFIWGLVLYSVYRFLIEFLRYSPLYYFGLTPSQWISVLIFGVSVGCFWSNPKDTFRTRR